MEKIEYKRTCNKCGRTWYVPKEYLNKLKSGKTDGTLAIIFFDIAQGSRNRQAMEMEMMRIKMCPNCNSSDFLEEIELINKEESLSTNYVKEEKVSRKTIIISIIITVIIIATVVIISIINDTSNK